MKKICVVVAGGRGKRMGTTLPKQFLSIKGEPLLMHTIRRIYSFEDELEILLVLPEDSIATWNNLCETNKFNVPHKIVVGGAERFFSVKNALEHVSEEGSLIAIHDGVRPFVSVDTWIRCIDGALKYGTAIPCVSVTSSLRVGICGKETRSVDRSLYLEVQTPQIFKSEIIKKAYSQSFSSLFTDDASITENIGVKTHTVEGNIENIKITTIKDIKIAESLLSEL